MRRAPRPASSIIESGAAAAARLPSSTPLNHSSTAGHHHDKRSPLASNPATGKDEQVRVSLVCVGQRAKEEAKGASHAQYKAPTYGPRTSTHPLVCCVDAGEHSFPMTTHSAMISSL